MWEEDVLFNGGAESKEIWGAGGMPQVSERQTEVQSLDVMAWSSFLGQTQPKLGAYT